MQKNWSIVFTGWRQYALTSCTCFGPTGASLLGRRLPSRVRQHSALSAVSWRFDLRGAANTQQLWRQSFCSFFGKHEHGALWLLIRGATEKHLLTYLHVSVFKRHLNRFSRFARLTGVPNTQHRPRNMRHKCCKKLRLCDACDAI